MPFFSPSRSPKDYQHQQPQLDIRYYLDGKIKAWGMIENRSGKITRRFVVDMIGTWHQQTGTLEEDFTFDDGEKSHRLWTIAFTDPNHFVATADDVIGEAKGSQCGNTLQMQYVLDLLVDKDKQKRHHVNLDDWMYLIDDKTLINTSTIKKFGITFAKLTIFFQKLTAIN